MSEVVVKKPNKLGAKVWISIVLFGFMGQLAWMVENMFFSNYIQANITKDGWATSATVAASAVVAALVTIFGGVLSDRLGKRKVFVSWGYIIWGLVTASFAFFGNEQFDESKVVAIVVVFVVMDCVMTVFGSMSNDAAFSSWVTDVTDITNRGFVDIILGIMPVAALMVIFVGFSGMTQREIDPVTNEVIKEANWVLFFVILGGMTALAGVAGLFLLKDSHRLKPDKSGKYMAEVVYGFRPKNVKKHKMIYICLIGMMFSGLAMQFWQPYMISMLQYTLGFYDGYVIPLAVVIVLSAVIAVVGGKLMDKFGKEKFFYPVAVAGVAGGLLVYFIKFVGNNMAAVYVMFILGGTLIEGASLLAAGLFNATARDYTPAEKAGCFQGVRIIIFVTLPMIIASIFCPLIIDGLGPVVKEFGQAPAAGYFPIQESFGYGLGDHVYPFELFLFSAAAALLMFIPTYFVHKENKKFRAQKLQEIHAQVGGGADTVADVDAQTDVITEQTNVDVQTDTNVQNVVETVPSDETDGGQNNNATDRNQNDDPKQ
ncbi:MAG: MFS transporter [Corallococcus sp.]|nr:MFS transporter [Corallococcus sp.]MCM1359898.1 MFS transporter [Corallococcus sp.]MCM1395332.1 MFS transporter [Corallococcus sp.]